MGRVLIYYERHVERAAISNSGYFLIYEMIIFLLKYNKQVK